MRQCSMLFVVLIVCASDLRAESPSSNSQIERLIADLDDDTYRVREAAQQKLVQLGGAAIATVHKATSSESLEVRFRARTILRQMVGAGLVLYLPMDRNPSNVSKHSEVKSAPDGDGNKGHAMRFQGRGYLIVPDAEQIDTDDQFTLMAWLKPSEIVYVKPAGSKDQGDEPVYPWGKDMARWDGHYIVAKWFSEAIHGDYLFAITPSGQLGLGVSDYRSGYRWDALHTKRTLKAQKWTHVAATFDRGEMKLYVDGKMEAEKRSTKVTQTSLDEYCNDDIFIGALWNDRYNFRGTIDEVRIYNRALSQQEIALLMMIRE